MNPKTKTELKNDLKEMLGRNVKANEVINMENDALLLARFCIKKIEELEDRILLLEKPIKIGGIKKSIK